MTAVVLYLPLSGLCGVYSVAVVEFTKKYLKRASPSASNTPNHRFKEEKTNTSLRKHPEHQQIQTSRSRAPKTEFLGFGLIQIQSQFLEPRGDGTTVKSFKHFLGFGEYGEYVPNYGVQYLWKAAGASLVLGQKHKDQTRFREG